MDDEIGNADYTSSHQMVFGNNNYIEEGKTAHDNNMIIYTYSTDSKEYSKEELTEWFETLINSFKRWSDFVFCEREKRTASIKKLSFPFEYRKGQKKLFIRQSVPWDRVRQTKSFI